jgi:hypothetical protein
MHQAACCGPHFKHSLTYGVLSKEQHSHHPSPTASELPSPCAVQVKRCYMKANLLVHPDKVKQKGGSLEQLVTADIAFDILKVAW